MDDLRTDAEHRRRGLAGPRRPVGSAHRRPAATCCGFATAGSVDDGKSTLIGRLLYDSKQLPDDLLEQITRDEPAARRRVRRPRPADRRAARRARAGHHDRRRLPLLPHAAAQVHHRRHAGPRAVHAQHGHRHVDGGPVADPHRCPQGHRRAVPAAHVHLVAARRAARRRVRQQDGPRRLGRVASSTHLRRVPRRSPRSSTSRTSVHPGQRAARRQRRRPLGGDALVRGRAAALPPRARAHRVGPQPRRRALPGAVGRAPDVPRPPRLPRLRRPGGRRRAAPRRRGHRAAVRPPQPDRGHRQLRRAARGGLPADVGDDAPRGRSRRLARRHDLPADEPAGDRARDRRDRLLDGRDPARPRARRYMLKQTTRTGERPSSSDVHYRIDMRTLHRDEGAAAARAQRDRSRRPAHEHAAARRRLPSQPLDRAASSSSTRRRTRPSEPASCCTRRCTAPTSRSRATSRGTRAPCRARAAGRRSASAARRSG